jgi:RNA polymerase sigma factor, sigma-70 family
VDAARRGDRHAFDALLGAYQAQVRGFLLRRVGPEVVDDLLQDVWLAAWVAMPRFQKRACFRTYLYSIAVNKCMDYHRSQSRAAAAAASLTQEVEASGGPGGRHWRSPEDLYAAAELRDSVRQIVDALPPPQREVLDLYYYAEMNLPEIARVLGRNLNTVKYQFYRAHDLVGQSLSAPGGPLSAVPGGGGNGVTRREAVGKRAAARGGAAGPLSQAPAPQLDQEDKLMMP